MVTVSIEEPFLESSTQYSIDAFQQERLKQKGIAANMAKLPGLPRKKVD